MTGLRQERSQFAEVLDGGHDHSLGVCDLSVHHSRHQPLDLNLHNPTKACSVNHTSHRNQVTCLNTNILMRKTYLQEVQSKVSTFVKACSCLQCTILACAGWVFGFCFCFCPSKAYMYRVCIQSSIHSFNQSWWRLFLTCKHFWENAQPFIPCLCFFLFFFKWRLVHTH